MITGDNALTACHVAKEVLIMSKEPIILDCKEGVQIPTKIEGIFFFFLQLKKLIYFLFFSLLDLEWRTTDESIILNLDVTLSKLKDIFSKYDICATGRTIDILAGNFFFLLF